MCQAFFLFLENWFNLELYYQVLKIEIIRSYWLMHFVVKLCMNWDISVKWETEYYLWYVGRSEFGDFTILYACCFFSWVKLHYHCCRVVLWRKWSNLHLLIQLLLILLVYCALLCLMIIGNSWSYFFSKQPFGDCPITMGDYH